MAGPVRSARNDAWKDYSYFLEGLNWGAVGALISQTTNIGHPMVDYWGTQFVGAWAQFGASLVGGIGDLAAYKLGQHNIIFAPQAKDEWFGRTVDQIVDAVIGVIHSYTTAFGEAWAFSKVPGIRVMPPYLKAELVEKLADLATAGGISQFSNKLRDILGDHLTRATKD